MLAHAALDIAAREEEIAAQEMAARLLRNQPVLDGGRLSPVQVCERPLQVVGDPLHRSEPEPDAASLGVTRCRVHRAFVGTGGGRHGTQVMQNVALAGTLKANRSAGSTASA